MSYLDEEKKRELIEREKMRLLSIVFRSEMERRSNNNVANDLERYLEEVEWRYGKDVKDAITDEIGMDNDGRPRHMIEVENVEFRRPTGSFAAYTQKEREMSSQPKDSNLPENKEMSPPLPVPPIEAQTNVQSFSEKVISQAIRGEYIYGMLGLILGLASIVGGIVLFLRGVTGSTSWTAKFLGLESQINDAAPGVVLFIVGLFMVRVTKPKVKLSDLKG